MTTQVAYPPTNDWTDVWAAQSFAINTTASADLGSLEFTGAKSSTIQQLGLISTKKVTTNEVTQYWWGLNTSFFSSVSPSIGNILQ
jgi:hypothetical protein